MDLRSSLANVTWPAMTTGLPAQLLALQYQFEASQFWPEATLRAHQFDQLRLLLAHADRTVPFHATRLHAAGIDPSRPLTEDAWSRLPILTRRDVQREGERLQSAQVPAEHGKLLEASSGGSTGVPVRVRKTALDNLLWNAVNIREELWNREDPGGTIARIRNVPPGFTEEQAAQIHSPRGLILDGWGPPSSLLWRTGRIGVIEYRRPMADQVAFMQALQPDYLFTFPSNLRLLLGHCRDAGVSFPSLRSVWTLSEPVDDVLRALCHQVFDVRIVSNYSASELGYIGLQCPEQPHYHVQSETMLVEVLDADGRPCAPGEVGRVIVTPLHNFAMPLLRYELGDEAEVGGPCACGRTLPVLTRIVGRTRDYLTLPDGRQRRVDINHYRVANVTAVREFQIVQRSLTRIEVLLVLGRPLTEEETAELRAVMDEEFPSPFQVELTPCGSIERTPAGKLRMFVSDLAVPG